MLSIKEIKNTTHKIAPNYPIKRVLLFGSYALGNANELSDVDLLVEFFENPISLFELAGFNEELREALKVSVDTVKLPLKKSSLINIDKVVSLYEQ
ncbi:MAG: hypothetical protein COA82_04440 [Alkaliphilus sp.]|nr:nucleotidyltransferase domain-containing protein [bacterium AH-315-L21]PHS35494.1 MAG: hypothetical protein COA82_04440 [Alkaliphilus sp.]